MKMVFPERVDCFLIPQTIEQNIQSVKGENDGMKVDQMGNLWATGPGGVLIFDPKGKTSWNNPDRSKNRELCFW